MHVKRKRTGYQKASAAGANNGSVSGTPIPRNPDSASVGMGTCAAACPPSRESSSASNAPHASPKCCSSATWGRIPISSSGSGTHSSLLLLSPGSAPSPSLLPSPSPPSSPPPSPAPPPSPSSPSPLFVPAPDGRQIILGEQPTSENAHTRTKRSSDAMRDRILKCARFHLMFLMLCACAPLARSRSRFWLAVRRFFSLHTVQVAEKEARVHGGTHLQPRNKRAKRLLSYTACSRVNMGDPRWWGSIIWRAVCRAKRVMRYFQMRFGALSPILATARANVLSTSCRSSMRHPTHTATAQAQALEAARDKYGKRRTSEPFRRS